MNKLVKDFIVRYQILRRRRVSYIPGWDCHGLPIELKALEAGARKSAKKLTAIDVRKLARQHALQSLESQKKDFREWGVMGDWNNHWTTMDLDYEVRQLKVFTEMLDLGLIYRRFKPVYWSCQSNTALAEAELEYAENHKSTTAYVKFPVCGLGQLREEIAKNCDIDPDALNLSALIWTTTPWTIPANKAIAVNPVMTYRIVMSPYLGALLIADSRFDAVVSAIGELETIVHSIPGSKLTDTRYLHPLRSGDDAYPQPIFCADFVTSISGTGIVHCAPGHGMEDYILCQQHCIEPYSPVDEHGNFSSLLYSGLEELIGKPVLSEGQEMVIDRLKVVGALAKLQRGYRHKYPYDWRSKKPVIIRATAQWFANVGSIKDISVKSLEDVIFIPSTGRHRLSSFINERSEWCISRQRSWGVPIPALFDCDTDEALLTASSVRHIVDEISKHGTDAWFAEEEDISHWISPEYRDNGRTYYKSRDTMDVWFDSGTSWTLMESLFKG